MKKDLVMVQEMNLQEMESVNGGAVVPWRLVGQCIGAFIEAYDIASDFTEGWNSVK